MAATAVLLIRHAEPEPPTAGSSDSADNERPLTVEGRRGAERLAVQTRAEPITGVFSGPYTRALETVEPIASLHGLAVQTIEDLRERRLSSSPLEGSAFLNALQRPRRRDLRVARR